MFTDVVISLNQSHSAIQGWGLWYNKRMEKIAGYHEKHFRVGKKVILAGVAFDAEMRNLSDRKVEVT